MNIIFDWLNANGQFITTAIAIIVAIVPTMAIKVWNENKIAKTLSKLRVEGVNAEDLGNKLSVRLNKVDNIVKEIPAKIEDLVNKTVAEAQARTDEVLSTLSVQGMNVVNIANEAVINLQTVANSIKHDIVKTVKEQLDLTPIIDKLDKLNKEIDNLKKKV